MILLLLLWLQLVPAVLLLLWLLLVGAVVMVVAAVVLWWLHMIAVHYPRVVGVGNFQSSALLIIGIYPSRYHENKFPSNRSTGKIKQKRRGAAAASSLTFFGSAVVVVGVTAVVVVIILSSTLLRSLLLPRKPFRFTSSLMRLIYLSALPLSSSIRHREPLFFS